MSTTPMQTERPFPDHRKTCKSNINGISISIQLRTSSLRETYVNTPDSEQNMDTIEHLIRDFAAEGSASSLLPLVGVLNRTDIPASEAIRNVDRALRTFRDIGMAGANDARDLQILSAIAQTYETLGGLEKAYDVYVECRDACIRLGEQASAADTLWKMGRVQRKRNRWEEALDHLRESRDLHESAGDATGIARCRIAEGNVFWELGDLETGADAFRQALETGEQIGDNRIGADASNNLGILSIIQGDFDQAEVHFSSAKSYYEQLGLKGSVAHVQHNVGMCHLARGRWEPALDAFEKSLAVSLDTGNLRLSASTYVQKAAIYVELKDTQVAASFCARALDIFREVDYPLGQAEALKILGRISVARQNWSTAEGLLGESLRICTDYSNLLGAAETRRELGVLNRARNREDDARGFLQQAVEGFVTIGAKHDVARTRALLEEAA